LNTGRLLANSVYSKEISRIYNAEPGGKFKKAVASGKRGMLNFKKKIKERNARLFNQCSCTSQELTDLIMQNY
jgi:hypothetical protein